MEIVETAEFDVLIATPLALHRWRPLGPDDRIGWGAGMKPSSWARDADIIENEVIMHRQTHRGASCLLLEGEDDHRFWDRRVSQGCELVIGDGKQNVEGAVRRLDTRRFSGALGIVDADFDRLQGRALPSPNLLATDAHDLECVLLRSPALDGVLAEYGDRAKIRRFEATQGGTVRDALLARGLIFGRLRWLARAAPGLESAASTSWVPSVSLVAKPGRWIGTDSMPLS